MSDPVSYSTAGASAAASTGGAFTSDPPHGGTSSAVPSQSSSVPTRGEKYPSNPLPVSSPMIRYTLPELLYRRQTYGGSFIGDRGCHRHHCATSSTIPNTVSSSSSLTTTSTTTASVLSERRCFPPIIVHPTTNTSNVSNDQVSDASTINDIHLPRHHPDHVPPSYLAYRGAWNLTRLQNTILVVGPGTPASVLYNHTVDENKRSTIDRDNNHSRAESDDEDENEDEDHDSTDQTSENKKKNKRRRTDRSIREDDCHSTTPLQGHEQEEDDDEMASDSDSSKSNDIDDDDDNDDDGVGGRSRRSRWTLRKPQQNETEISKLEVKESQSDSDMIDDDDDDKNGDDNKNAMADQDEQDRQQQQTRKTVLKFEDVFHQDDSTMGAYRLMRDGSSDDDDDDDGGSVGGDEKNDVANVQNSRDDNDDNDDDDDHSSSSSSSESSAGERHRRRFLHELEDMDDDDDDNDEEIDFGDDDDDDGYIPPSQRNSKINVYYPSMRHAGCINTASWLDCGWKLSTYTDSSIVVKAMETDECPTQVITSGDDYQIKVWDVRNAMGSVSPIAGGRATICPFSESVPSISDTEELVEQWAKVTNASSEARGMYGNVRKGQYLPGSVRLLTTTSTGHHGNVFCATPIRGKPGKVATCGADGFLRLVDLEQDESTPVISPEYDDELGLLPAGFLSFRSAMCFSHHFLNENVGLLCSERGLRRFDIRLPPREQPTESLLGGSLRSCKACAILSAPTSSSLDQGDSAYVFAGGSSPTVALCDLRMTSQAKNSTIIQSYRPSSLSVTDSVSVSGLDVSKDGKELLVSYESDQIYTFPIFPNSKIPNSSKQDCIHELISQKDEEVKKRKKKTESNDDDGESSVLPSDRPGRRYRRLPGKALNELAAYGGHLNRFTFLKNARFAGPRDEYICTGSDSGNAWIYQKSTGVVASFLKADNSTCNGIVPHPSLPFFISYGIDSTAKMWRATTPIDSEVDDSPVGRRQHHSMSHLYRMSAVCSDWTEIQTVLDATEPSDTLAVESDLYPDQIPSLQAMKRSRMSRSSWIRRAFCSMTPGKSPTIGNNLHNLPITLEDNLFTCLQSMFDDGDVPVESDVDALKHRITLIRLHHQAQTLGLKWDPRHPWIMEPKAAVGNNRIETQDNVTADDVVEPSDLVPNYPSDWIPYDQEMANVTAFDFNDYFNRKDYDDFYRERYGPLDENGWTRFQQHECDSLQTNCSVDAINEEFSDDDENVITHMSVDSDESSNKEVQNDEVVRNGSKVRRSDGSGSQKKNNRSLNVLLETIKVLKDGGNDALKRGDYDLAASRYDKAIQYGAVHFMRFYAQSGPYLNGSSLGATGSITQTGKIQEREWSELLKIMIATRLNLALVLLKPYFGLPDIAASQAELALKDLLAITEFEVKKKALAAPSQTNSKPPASDPIVDEALSLQAKAYFRLGSAQFAQKKYHNAIYSFESSVLSTQMIGDGTTQPDNLVVRRLKEARREYSNRAKRQRKKFKIAFASSPAADERKKMTDESCGDSKGSTIASPQTAVAAITDRNDIAPSPEGLEVASSTSNQMSVGVSISSTTSATVTPESAGRHLFSSRRTLPAEKDVKMTPCPEEDNEEECGGGNPPTSLPLSHSNSI